MYDSLKKTVEDISEYALFWPSHDIGCGKSMDAPTATPLNYKLQTSWWEHHI